MITTIVHLFVENSNLISSVLAYSIMIPCSNLSLNVMKMRVVGNGFCQAEKVSLFLCELNKLIQWWSNCKEINCSFFLAFGYNICHSTEPVGREKLIEFFFYSANLCSPLFPPRRGGDDTYVIFSVSPLPLVLIITLFPAVFLFCTAAPQPSC